MRELKDTPVLLAVAEDRENRRLRCGKGRVVRTLCGGGFGGGSTTAAAGAVAQRLEAGKQEFNQLTPNEQQQRLAGWAASLNQQGTEPARQQLTERNAHDLSVLATRQATLARQQLAPSVRTKVGAKIDGELQNHLAKLRLGHGITDPGTALTIRGLLDEAASRGEVHRCLSCGRFASGDADTTSCPHCAVGGTPHRPPQSREGATVGLAKSGEPNQYGEVYSAAVEGNLPQDVAQVMAGVAVPTAESPAMLAYYQNYLRNLTGLDATLHFGTAQWTSWREKGIEVEIDPYPLTRAAAYREGLVARGVAIAGADIPRLRRELALRGVVISEAADAVEAIGDATHEAAHMMHSTISSTTAAHLFAAGRGPVSGLDGKKVAPSSVRRQLELADPELWQRCHGWLEQPVDPDPKGRYSAIKRRVFNHLHNILADGHDERCHLEGDLNRIIAGDTLFERWHFDPENDPDYRQLEGAMLYEALPAKEVPVAQLKPAVRQFFEQELRPLVQQATAGTSTDLTVAAFQIYDKLDAAGYFDRELEAAASECRGAFDSGDGEVCENVTGGAAPGQGGKPGQPGQGEQTAGEGGSNPTSPGSGGRGNKEGPQPANGAATGQTSSGGAGGQSSDEPTQGDGHSDARSGQGAGGTDEAAKREALQQAEAALERAQRQEERALGNKLLPGSFRYAGPQGNTTALRFAQRKARLRSIAARFAVEIERIKTQAIRDRKFQTRGRLDRRRLVAAAKGSQDIYIDPGRTIALDMAAVVVGDTSGSMSGRVNALADAVTVCSMAFDKTGVPHELCSFNNRTYLHKSFGQQTAEGVEQMPNYSGSTAMTQAVGFGAKRLASRPEHSRVLYIATDGAPNDFPSCREAVLQARRAGITVFGIYMGDVGMNLELKQAVREQMARLFDQDQVVLERVEDIPTVVGGQLIRALKAKLKR